MAKRAIMYAINPVAMSQPMNCSIYLNIAAVWVGSLVSVDAAEMWRFPFSPARATVRGGKGTQGSTTGEATIRLLAITLFSLLFLIFKFGKRTENSTENRIKKDIKDIKIEMSTLKALVLPAKSQHTHTVLILHGLGDSGAGWFPVAKMLQPLFPQVKWICPHAPERPITLNFGMEMPGWYDIASLDKISSREDEHGTMESFNQISMLIQKEMLDSKLTADHIIVGGFSQGAAMSLVTACLAKEKFAGVFALSGYIPLQSKLISTVDSAPNKDTPVAFFHGDSDQVVQMKYGKESMQWLKKHFTNVTWKQYPGLGHSANDDELRDLATFLSSVIGK
jgi:predicted esterase